MSAYDLTQVEPTTFTGASVVQVVGGDPSRFDAVVATLHPATVELTARRVIAVDGDVEWSWLIEDLREVHHGVDGPWSILVVPGVSDHGVAVRQEDTETFRRRIDLLWTASSPAAHIPPTPTPAAPARGPAAGESNRAWADPTSPPEMVDEPTVIDDQALAFAAPRHIRGQAPLQGILRRARTKRQMGAGARSTQPSAAPAPAPLDARNVSAWFGTHNVLDQVSLLMPAGRVTALIGPSGCGKSTFLRILNRMHELTPSAAMAGEVLLDGQDVYDPSRKITDARREIGMVFQKPNPFPAMSIYDNVIASLRLTGTKATAEEKDSLVESCLSKAGLWSEVRDRLRQPGGGLSGGQQQRLCIARALAIRPRALLMDEPCSALDPTSTRRIEETIHELAAEVTIVIVTHNMQQALRVSSMCAFFLAEQGTPGVIVEHGPTDAMFDAPQDTRTRDYVTGRFG